MENFYLHILFTLVFNLWVSLFFLDVYQQRQSIRFYHFLMFSGLLGFYFWVSDAWLSQVFAYIMPASLFLVIFSYAFANPYNKSKSIANPSYLERYKKTVHYF